MKVSLPVLVLLLSVSGVMAADLSEPAELLKLRESYTAEIARLSEPVTKRYIQALLRLQEAYTKAGQLDKALVVKGELSALSKLTDKDLDESRWSWGSGGTLTLHRNNKALHSTWSTPGVWKRLSDTTVQITKADGTKITLVFANSDFTEGEAVSDAGGRTVVKRLPK